MSDTPQTDSCPAERIEGLCGQLERERNEAREIIAAALSILPCGHIPSHTPESIPDRIRQLLDSWVTAEHELEKAVAERDEAREAAERYRRKTLSQDAELAEAHRLLDAAKESLNAIRVEVGGWIAAMMKGGK
jgi:hypothetical protein